MEREEVRKVLIEALRALLDLLGSGQVPKYGICSFVKDYGIANFNLYSPLPLLAMMGCLWENWPLYSGSEGYPIPGGGMAYSRCNRWWGEQYGYRVQLIEWLLMELENSVVTVGCE